MNEIDYNLYKITKSIIERASRCCNKNHSGEENFQYFENAIKFFDASDKGYAERYEKEKLMNDLISKKEMAFKELKTAIVKLMFDFTDQYSGSDNNSLYPEVGNILVDVLVECLQEAQYQIKGCPSFTSKQTDHICYQIGEWYSMMKPLLEGQHNLGHMKEKLKVMICGE